MRRQGRRKATRAANRTLARSRTRRSSNPGVQGDHVSFYQDTVRETKQTAAFASLDYDLIPKVLTITAGTRHFRFQNSSKGSVCRPSAASKRVSRRAAARARSATTWIQKGSRTPKPDGSSRANLTWHITPDHMVYYTFSQGFRPGGFNQNGGFFAYAPGPDGVAQYAVPPRLFIRQARQQRDRLEDRVVGSSAAMERRVLSREMGPTCRSNSSIRA